MNAAQSFSVFLSRKGPAALTTLFPLLAPSQGGLLKKENFTEVKSVEAGKRGKLHSWKV